MNEHHSIDIHNECLSNIRSLLKPVYDYGTFKDFKDTYVLNETGALMYPNLKDHVIDYWNIFDMVSYLGADVDHLRLMESIIIKQRGI